MIDPDVMLHIRHVRNWLMGVVRSVAAIDEVVSQMEYGFEMTANDAEMLAIGAERLADVLEAWPVDSINETMAELRRQAERSAAPNE